MPSTYSTGADTHSHKSLFIRYPHRRRLELALTLGPPPAGRVFDYGAGDGELLLLLAKERGPGDPIVGYEPISHIAADMRERISEAGFEESITLIESLEDLEEGLEFDVIYCLNVLEHLPLRERERFYEICKQTLAPRGSIVVDVPVELGLSLAIKEAGRLLLKGREAEYTVPQLVKTMAGRIPPDPERMRPEYTDFIRTHRNFDHRLLGRELEENFTIERTFCTPFPRLPAGAGNQEQFFVLRRQ